MIEANIDTWRRIRMLGASGSRVVKSGAIVAPRMMKTDLNSRAMGVINTQQRRQAGDRRGQQDR